MASALVTAGGHWGVLAAVRALAAAGHVAYVLAPHRGVYAARSRHAAAVALAPEPLHDPEAFARAAAAAASRFDVDAILPGTDPALAALAAHRGLLPQGIAVGAPDAEVVARATAKDALGALAARAGLRPPPTYVVTDGRPPAGVSFPAIVKPRLSLAPPRRVESEAELVAALEELPGGEHVVQPWLEGALAAVCGLAWEGELVASVHQEAVRIWPPDCGISAFAVTVPRDAELDDSVARLLGELGWSGLFQLQFLRTVDGPAPIDLNPRVYGSLALAVAAGQNLPAFWLELVLGRRVEAPREYRVGVAYRAEENDVRALARAGALALARGLVPRRATTHAVVALRDPAPALASLAKLVPQRFRRRP